MTTAPSSTAGPSRTCRPASGRRRRSPNLSSLEPSSGGVYAGGRRPAAGSQTGMRGHTPMATTTTSLLVIGAGPYALSTAAFARQHGIDTVVVGRPMGFWREHMPEGMFLRSGPDWHLDAASVHTLEAYLEERAIDPAEVDPLPVGLFLDYAEWFRQAKGIQVREDLVVDLAKLDARFEAVLGSGARIAADVVVAAPGIRHFTNLPAWASGVPAWQAAHTCDRVRFEDLSGARV